MAQLGIVAINTVIFIVLDNSSLSLASLICSHNKSFTQDKKKVPFAFGPQANVCYLDEVQLTFVLFELDFAVWTSILWTDILAQQC